MELYEKMLGREEIFSGRVLHVHRDQVELPNGHTSTREIVDHPGGVGILALDEQENVLVVSQYRYAYGEELYEIPAGKLEKGEDPAVTAARELEEEAGFIPEKMIPLYVLYPTPGYTNEKIYIYRAEGVREGRVHLDEGEFLSSAFYPLQEVCGMIVRGEIKDAKTIVAIQRELLDRASEK